MSYKPDYRNMVEVLSNRRPERLPVYEHLISTGIMEKIQNVRFAELVNGDRSDRQEHFKQYCRFFFDMTYDTVSYEYCILNIIPDSGAIMGGRPGPIQNRDDFEKFPWDELKYDFWEKAGPQFDLLAQSMPPGMKAIGGIGNGVFEISEDLVGFEYLAYMMMNDPELFANLYHRIGALMVDLWAEFLRRYKDDFAVCRFGDDLGFKTNTLISPAQIRQHILPQYKKVIDLIHQSGKRFLWHSCGNIFSIMEEMIEMGIDGKHSNEEAIAPFEKWISLYGDRIALVGGIDVDILCQEKPEDVFRIVIESGQKYRNLANGYALGSGNSIPDFVPPEGFLAMIRAAKEIRRIKYT